MSRESRFPPGIARCITSSQIILFFLLSQLMWSRLFVSLAAAEPILVNKHVISFQAFLQTVSCAPP